METVGGPNIESTREAIVEDAHVLRIMTYHEAVSRLRRDVDDVFIVFDEAHCVFNTF
jgi:Rad3-related DNA helicase